MKLFEEWNDHDQWFTAQNMNEVIHWVNRSITRATYIVNSAVTFPAELGVDYVGLCDLGAVPRLPTAVDNRNKYTVKNRTDQVLNVLATGAETMDGFTTFPVPPWASRDFISDNVNWSVV